MEWVRLGLWPLVTRPWRWEKWLLRVGLSEEENESGFRLDPVMVKAESLGDRVICVEAKTLGMPLRGKAAGRRETKPDGDGFAAMDKIGFSRVDIGFESGQQRRR